MTALTVENPLPTFTDTAGQPLQAGYVYLGTVNQDPRSSPVSAFFDQAMTIPASLPLRTTAGYVWRNGAPARVWTNGDCSMLVLDSLGRQVFYMGQLQGGDISTFMAGVLSATTALAARTALGFTAAIIDRAYAEYTTNADLTAAIPLDDTIPQVTEGTQILSAAITPKSTSSRIRIRFQCQFICSTTINVTAAAFVNGAANAVRATYNTNPASAFAQQIILECEIAPASVAAQTVTIRVGPTSSTIRLNGSSSGRLLGGAMAATLILEEIL